jgi:RNA polymerase sigma-70 factor (ECF subfamily)
MTVDSDKAPEAELIRRARKGDQYAFSEIVRRYQDSIYNLACRILNDQDRARDVTQEAFVRAWRAISNFKGQAKFSSWLYRITVNASLSELRRQGSPVDQYPEEELESIVPVSRHVSSFESAIEKSDLMEKLIASLPPVYRSIVVLFYVQDLDCKEIASVLGHPLGTVKAYLHRARAHLRKSAEQLLKTKDSLP